MKTMTSLEAQNRVGMLMKIVRELSPLSGKATVEAFREFSANAGNQAAQDGLTEAEVTAFVHANR